MYMNDKKSCENAKHDYDREFDKAAGACAQEAKVPGPSADDPLGRHGDNIQRMRKLAEMFGHTSHPGSGNWLTDVAARLESLEIEHQRRPVTIIQELGAELREVQLQRDHHGREAKRIGTLYREVQEACESLCKQRSAQNSVLDHRNQEIQVLKAMLEASERARNKDAVELQDAKEDLACEKRYADEWSRANTKLRNACAPLLIDRDEARDAYQCALRTIDALTTERAVLRSKLGVAS